MSNGAKSTAKDESRSFAEWAQFLWNESLARHVIVEKKGHYRPVDLPLLLLIIAALIAPWLVAIGLVLAVIMGYALRIESRGEPSEQAAEEPAWEPDLPGEDSEEPPRP